MLQYLKVGTNIQAFYIAVNAAYKKMFGEYQFIHFPYFINEGESFLESQQNLTHYCIDPLPSLEGKSVLEIGCGNGLQSIYVFQKYRPNKMVGIDINPDNIGIAQVEKDKLGLDNLDFRLDDAQKLETIPSDSIDIVLNIESALHYPDKGAFLKQVYRVLKPGAPFVVADVLSAETREYTYWDQKMYHLNWSHEQYLKGFEDAGLQVDSDEDITDRIVKGFLSYEHYFEDTALKNPISKFFIKKWAIQIFKFNAKNLQTKNCYRVFHGVKPLS